MCYNSSMRMRRKPNLDKRIKRCCSLLVAEPELLKGRWLAEFGFSKLHLELGCGKGSFTTQTASVNSEALLVALEKVDNVLVLALERALSEDVPNVRFMCNLADDLTDFFDSGEVSRIYLNFSDPWPARRHAKRRLTGEIFLSLYKKVLCDGGEVHFKTDNQDLFEFSLAEFDRCGFKLSEVSRNLHEFGVQGIMTDYEMKFHGEGQPIYRCVATWDRGEL
ncbi:MAG: tRNA (guanosine(46)-N7)-methyltransferase TrmB [Oscillospiraceae bacterium]|nr:tRNA (guanosine(46)-N7)-methyltransferase TrmB [Oscillospiraceae bacterium]